MKRDQERDQELAQERDQERLSRKKLCSRGRLRAALRARGLQDAEAYAEDDADAEDRKRDAYRRT